MLLNDTNIGMLMLCSYEPLFNQYGVDILIHGHVHSYERTNPVIQYMADASGCAPTYVTIGDGGNLEKVGWAVQTTRKSHTAPVAFVFSLEQF